MKIKNIINEFDLAILLCFSKLDYPEKAPDIPRAELVKCPECNELMWLGEKKKKIKESLEAQKKNMVFCCSRCAPVKLKECMGDNNYVMA